MSLDCRLVPVQYREYEYSRGLQPIVAKNAFLAFWRFSGWMWAKLTLIYSKGHLQHDSMPFYPPSIALYDIFARACAEIKILTYVFFAFLFFALILSVCCSAWLTFDWACFHFKTFRESIIETGNFYHEIATCSRRKFCSVVCHSNIWAFSSIFQAPLRRSLWSEYQ